MTTASATGVAASPPPPPRRRTLPDRSWVPALAGLLLAVGFVGALLVRADGDVSLLVHAAPVWTDVADDPPGSLTVQPSEDDAFDGQFFYRLGVSPFSTDETVAGVTFDLPSLRNARWGYGALAFVASGGDEDLVPWALVGLNVAALTAVGALGGALAASSGRHRAWGALFVTWPGFAYSLSLDTSELVASAFVLGGLVALRRRRWVGTALLLTAAVLTRDTTAVIPFGIVVAGVWAVWTNRTTPTTETGTGEAVVALEQTPPDQVAGVGSAEPRADRPGPEPAGRAVPETPAVEPSRLVAAGTVPLIAFGCWQVLQQVRFGTLPLTSSGDNNLTVPLEGLASEAVALLPPSGGAEAFRLLSMAGLLVLLLVTAWAWHRSSARPWERLGWVTAVAVVAVLNAYLWSGATAFMRASTEAGLLSILLVLSTRWRLHVLALGLGGFWLLTALAQVSKLG